MFINKAIVIGNITKDIELKSLPNGTQVASFSVATNEVYKDKDGNKQESVEYHNVVVFGKQAENTARYMKKGSSIYIEGKIKTRSWDDKDTQKKLYRTEIIANIIQFGSTPKSDQQSKPATSPSAPQDSSEIDYPTDDINPEDIPF